MLKKTITYRDFDNNERTEDFYFNLTKSEIAEWELSKDGGMSKVIQRVVASPSAPELMSLFKDVILRAYGEKTDDGKHFIKSKELSTLFTQTGAYDVLFQEIMFDAKSALAFFKGIMPEDMVTNVTNDPEELISVAREQGIKIPEL